MRGALDDKDRVGIGDDTERDGGEEPLGLGRRRGRVRTKVRGEALDGAQCEWPPQLPPQQPPDLGGPREEKSVRFPAPAGAAGIDISLVTLAPPHDGHATRVSERTRVSKRDSQALH